jgi:uncharacterized repeat protein (TIGR01451 family)
MLVTGASLVYTLAVGNLGPKPAENDQTTFCDELSTV